MREHVDRVTVRNIAATILQDPLMTLRMLRFIARRRGKRQLQDISTIDNAVMMLGVEPFFHHFAQFDVIEDQLKPQPQALLQLLHVVRRARRAARYAQDWATWRYDLNSEEVGLAALLHDVAEMLAWSFAPKQTLKMYELQNANPALSGSEVQRAVLGFTLHDLQSTLCTHWKLPELLSSVLEDRHSDRVRVKNVKLAVDFARHSANGWDHPALPDDFRAIAALMNINEETLQRRLGVKLPGDGKLPPKKI